MELLIPLTVSVLCAIACALIAENKGRSGMTWGIIGFLAGIFALIGILIVPRNPKGVEERKLASGEMRQCPHCAELIRSEANVCRYCGRDLYAAQPQQTPVTSTTTPETSAKSSWRCECGQYNFSDRFECIVCKRRRGAAV